MTRNQMVVQDLRVEMAKLAALGGGIGLILSIVVVVLRALGFAG